MPCVRWEAEGGEERREEDNKQAILRVVYPLQKTATLEKLIQLNCVPLRFLAMGKLTE